MLPVLIAPVIYLGARYAARTLVQKAVDQGVRDGVGRARSEVSTQVRQMLRGYLITVLINVMSISLAVLATGVVLMEETGKLLVCSVYLVSVVTGTFSAVGYLPKGVELARHRFKIKSYIQAQIYAEALKEARKEINSLGSVKRLFNQLWGKSPHELAHAISHRTIETVMKEITVKLLQIGVAMLFYVVLFRMVVAPMLIGGSTGLTLLQSLLWPFAYSLDFFTGSELAIFIEHMN